MKNLILFCLSCLALPLISQAQKVWLTENKTEANILAFVVPSKKEATLVVYKTEDPAEVQRKSGVWYFTQSKSEATWRVCFTKNKAEANVIVYYTQDKKEAGFVVR